MLLRRVWWNYPSPDQLMSEHKRKVTKGTDGTGGADARSRARPPQRGHEEGFIPPHGGYEQLFSYAKTQIIYDATVRFCDRFINRKSRTHDQMVQAARSGNKNVAEGSRLSGTSKEAELKLTNVARASLEELLGDYTDYLRQHGNRRWEKDSREALYVRKLGRKDDLSYEDFREFIETRPAETVANILISLIHQANYLLDRQIKRLERDFLEEGGLRERMLRARLAARAKQSPGGARR
jgi:four helix bundle suffix protein